MNFICNASIRCEYYYFQPPKKSRKQQQIHAISDSEDDEEEEDVYIVESQALETECSENEEEAPSTSQGIPSKAVKKTKKDVKPPAGTVEEAFEAKRTIIAERRGRTPPPPPFKSLVDVSDEIGIHPLPALAYHVGKDFYAYFTSIEKTSGDIRNVLVLRTIKMQKGCRVPDPQTIVLLPHQAAHLLYHLQEFRRIMYK